MGFVDLSGHLGATAVGGLTETEGRTGAGRGAWAKAGAGLSSVKASKITLGEKDSLAKFVEEDEHLAEEVGRAPPGVCSAGPGVSEGPWTGGGHSGETIGGPASLACCHRCFPYTQRGK